MSLESDLYTVLTAQCPRVYPDTAPPNTTRPYVTWQQIGGQAPTFVERATPSVRNARIQVNVFTTTRISANALMLAIEAALTASDKFQCKPESAHVNTHDPDFDDYGCMQDFSIWAQR